MPKMKKSGGSPKEVTVTFKFLSGKNHKVIVKNGATYGDAINEFLHTYNGPDYGISDGIFIINGKAINTEQQLKEKITDDINIFINRFNVGGALEFTIALDDYNDENPDRLQEIIKKIEAKKIAKLKKELPALLESVKVVNSISHNKIGKINSASSDKDYVEPENIIRLSRKENNKEFITWHDKEELLKWLKLKGTLPTSRSTVTAADIKKIEDSVGYGQLIKIGSRASQEATTSNGEIRNNPANASSVTSSAASSRRTASGRSIITVNSTHSNHSSASAPSRRSSARTGSPISRTSTNNPDGSRRSSARTTPSPRLSPRANARRDS